MLSACVTLYLAASAVPTRGEGEAKPLALSKLAGRAVVSPNHGSVKQPHGNVPVIPDQFYAQIYGNTTGTVQGVP